MINLALVVVLSASTGMFLIRSINQGGIFNWLISFFFVLATCTYGALAVQDLKAKQKTISRLTKNAYLANPTINELTEQ